MPVIHDFIIPPDRLPPKPPADFKVRDDEVQHLANGLSISLHKLMPHVDAGERTRAIERVQNAVYYARQVAHHNVGTQPANNITSELR